MGRYGPPPKPNVLRQRRNKPPSALILAAERPACPHWLSPEAKKEWRRIVPLLLKNGLLRKEDQAVLAAYCAYRAEWEDYQAQIVQLGPVLESEGSAPKPSPYVKLASDACDRMLRCAREFGLSPSARAGLGALLNADTERTAQSARVTTATDASDPRQIFNVV